MKCKGYGRLVVPPPCGVMSFVVVLLCLQSAVVGSSSGDPGLKVATCQFPVSADIDENARYVKDFNSSPQLKGPDHEYD